jgi:hypothetical protein
MNIDELFKEIIERIDRLEMQTGTPRKPWPELTKPAPAAAKKPGRPKKDEETSDE